METIKDHLGWLVGGGFVLVVFAVKFAPRLWSIAQTAIQTEIQLGERRDRLLSITEADRESYKKLCDQKDARILELERALQDSTRQVQTRDEINGQDRVMIRLLKEKMQQHLIDYDDLERQVRDKVKGHK